MLFGARAAVRIAVVTTSWPRFEGDPSGHFVATEVRALTQRSDVGKAPEVVVIHAEGEAFGWPGLAARVKESPLRLVGAAAWVVEARRKIREGEFDAVVAHWAVPCAWPIATPSAAGRWALHVVSHGGDVRALARMPRPLGGRLVRHIAERAETWRFVSAALLDSLLAVLPPATKRTLARIARVGPSPIDVAPPSAEAVAAKRREIGVPFSVCVARLVASKRVHAALAWAAESGRVLVVVGDGPERASLEALAKMCHARVHFTGTTSRPDALAWIAASEELVQPSREEGLSTVIREAEALRVRVVEI